MRLRRGLALAAGAAVLVLLLAALATTIVMQPRRLAGLVLGGVGDGLGLNIRFEGDARYRLRGTPLLEVHDVVVRRPGDHEPILRAARALVSLPWSTVRGRGTPLTLDHVELDAPVIDLPRLQAWLAARPPGAGRLPTLSNGITVRDGSVLGEGWELEGLQLRMQRLAEDAPLAADASGVVALGAATLVHFDLHVAATRPADGAGVGARGRVRVEREGWQLPAFVTASGPIGLRGGSVHVAPLRFGASGEYRGTGEPLRFSIGVQGPLRWRDGTWTLVPAGVALRGDDVVPTLDARGRAALGRALLLEFDGRMPAWPAGWPALPAPLGASAAPVDIAIRYAGAPDVSDAVALRMQRDQARATASARILDVVDWIDAAATSSPLPPLRGHASAPRIEIAGAVLEGVELSIEQEDEP